MSHFSTDSVQMVVWYQHQAVLKGVVPGRVKWRSTRPNRRFQTVGRDVRHLVLYFLARKITRRISHISTESVQLLDVRYSVLYFLARKITRFMSHFSTDSVQMVVWYQHQAVLKGVVPGRVKGRRTRPCKGRSTRPNRRFQTVGRDVRYSVLYFLARKSQDAYRTSRPSPFSCSMCEIRFCISWPEKSQDSCRTSRPILFRWSCGINTRPC